MINQIIDIVFQFSKWQKFVSRAVGLFYAFITKIQESGQNKKYLVYLFQTIKIFDITSNKSENFIILIFFLSKMNLGKLFIKQMRNMIVKKMKKKLNIQIKDKDEKKDGLLKTSKLSNYLGNANK